MQDPEFLKLFEEYAREISDPNTLRETDLYIKQLEGEGSTIPSSIVIPKAVSFLALGFIIVGRAFVSKPRQQTRKRNNFM